VADQPSALSEPWYRAVAVDRLVQGAMPAEHWAAVIGLVQRGDVEVEQSRQQAGFFKRTVKKSSLPPRAPGQWTLEVVPLLRVLGEDAKANASIQVRADLRGTKVAGTVVFSGRLKGSGRVRHIDQTSYVHRWLSLAARLHDGTRVSIDVTDKVRHRKVHKKSASGKHKSKEKERWTRRIDIEVAGDGKNVRGVYMDWMASRTVAHPLAAGPRDVVPEPFAAAAPLHTPEKDTETFGTVTAALAPETIRIGASISQGAAFQFGVESQPLLALLTFEVSSARVDSPPEVYVNGQSLGPVSLTLTDLADPGYRGETQRLIDGMRFRYTGWLRAQKLVPASNLRAGTNDVIVIGGPGTPMSAIRATQIQLKYLWDKSDYLLDPK